MEFQTYISFPAKSLAQRRRRKLIITSATRAGSRSFRGTAVCDSHSAFTSSYARGKGSWRRQSRANSMAPEIHNKIVAAATALMRGGARYLIPSRSRCCLSWKPLWFCQQLFYPLQDPSIRFPQKNDGIPLNVSRPNAISSTYGLSFFMQPPKIQLSVAILACDVHVFTRWESLLFPPSSSAAGHCRLYDGAWGKLIWLSFSHTL